MLARAMAVAAGLVTSAAAFGSGVTITPVLVQGLQAPGKPPGFTIKSVGNAPAIGDGGHIVTDAVRFTGPGLSANNNYYIGYTGLPGSLAILQEAGLPAGTLGPDVQFVNSGGALKSRPNLVGDFVFVHPVSGLNVDSTNNDVMFAHQGGVSSVLFRESSFLPSFPNGEFVTQLTDEYRFARLLDSGNLLARVRMKGGPGGVAIQDNLLAGPVAAPAVVLAWGSPPPGCAENLASLDLTNMWYHFSPTGKFIVKGKLAGAPTTSDDAFWTGDASGGPVSLWLREGSSLPGIHPANVVGTPLHYGDSINDAGQALVEFRLQTGVGDTMDANDRILVYGTPGNLSVLAREDDQVPGMLAGVRYYQFDWFGGYNGGVIIGTSLVGNVSATNDEVILAGPPGSLSVKLREGDPAPGFPVGYTLGTFGINSDFLKMNSNGHFAVTVRVISNTGENLWAIYACTPNSAPQLVFATYHVLEVAPGEFRMVRRSSTAVTTFGGNINALDQITFRAGFIDDTEAVMVANVSFTPAPSFVAGTAPTVSDAAGNADGVLDPAESTIGLTIPVHNGGALGATGVTATLFSLTPTVTVQTASAAYPDLSSGAAGGNATPFVISVSPSHPCGSPAILRLHVTSNEGANNVGVFIPTGLNYAGCAAFTAGAIAVSDAAGNGSGLADPGESAIELTIPVSKSGGAGPSTGITGTLTSLTPTASIVTGLAAYPNLNAGATAGNLSPFVIALSPSHPCGTPVNLQLTVSADSGVATSVVGPVLSTGLSHPSCATFGPGGSIVVSDTSDNGNNNGSADPGESSVALAIPVTKTSGTGANTGITATLISLTSTVTVVSGSAAYPDINAMATASNTTPFVVALDSAHPCGAPVDLQLTLSTDGGLGSGVVNFALATGTPPTVMVASWTNPANAAAGLPIPELGSGLSVSVNVSGAVLPVGDVNFRFDNYTPAGACSTSGGSPSAGLTHNNANHIRATLTSPSGTSVILLNAAGGGGNNFCNTVIDDEAAATIPGILDQPFSKSYKPSGSGAGPMSAFDGQNANGTWTLKVEDLVTGTTGTLRAWSLILTEASVCQSPGAASDLCCRGTTCNAIAAGSCTGTVAGSASIIVGSCGTGGSIATCCFADFNHDGTPSIDDLFLYLNAYFSGSPWANVGGDGVVSPTIDDLFLYINAYFTGCA